MPSRIPFIRPALPSASKLSEDLASMVESNWFSNFGPFERRFRNEIAGYVGKEVVAVTMNNATTGLLAALAATLPRGNGEEEVAVASFTFAAAAHAITWHGYNPTWVDIDEASLQPSRASMSRLLEQSDAIRAIILTNTFGIANEEIGEWEELARDAGIPLIVDSAAGFGSTYADGERMGARGDCEIFSFHATKPFAIGEGGALVTKDPTLAETSRRFTNFGFVTNTGAIEAGLNGKMQEINAAIGLHQIKTFDDALRRRRDVFEGYTTAFAGLPLHFPRGIETSSLCFATVVLDDPKHVTHCLQVLADSGIDARTYYSPNVHFQPWFQRFQPRVPLTVSERIATQVISLPVLADMTQAEIDHVAVTVQNAFSNL